MKKTKQMKVRNFVAKHMKQSGTGVHKAKSGRFASRARNKQNFLRNKGDGNE